MGLKEHVLSIVQDLEDDEKLVTDDGQTPEDLGAVLADTGDWIVGFDKLIQNTVDAPYEDTEYGVYCLDYWITEDGTQVILGGSPSDDLRRQNGFDFLKDALDIEYIVKGRKPDDYLGVRVLVAFGGPNIWINTRTNTVEGYWWGEEYHASFRDYVGLDEACQEMWNNG